MIEINLLLTNFTHPKQIGDEKIENQQVRGAVLIYHKILIKGEQKQAVIGVGGACFFSFEWEGLGLLAADSDRFVTA